MKYFCLKLVLVILVATCLSSILSPNALAKNPYGLAWTIQATPSAVATDSLNNIYYAGFVANNSPTEFNPWYKLTPSHETSDVKTATTGAIFLSKMNSNYTYDHTYLIESNSLNGVSLTEIATDSAGNIFLLGSFNGTVDFDPTLGIDFRSSASQTWQFLTQIKADGGYGQTYLWQNSNIVIRDMVIDRDDDIFLAGILSSGGGNLDPIDGDDNQTVANGETLGFYTKLAAGNPRTYGYSGTFKNISSQYLELDHLALDSKGNVFLYGVFSASTKMNFNLDAPGESNFKSSYGGTRDLYVSKYDSNGNYLTTYFVGGLGNESAQVLGLDYNDNVYYTGGFNDVVNFNPINPLVIHDDKVATVADQRFLSKLNADGTYGYTLTWNSNSLSFKKITFDSNNLIYLVGVSSGAINYDPITAIDNISGIGGNDAFMTVLNPNKTYGYTYIWGGKNDDEARDASFDAFYNLYIAGSTKSREVNFDPTTPIGLVNSLEGGVNGYLTSFLSNQLLKTAPTPTPPKDAEFDLSLKNQACTNSSPDAPRIFQIAAAKDKSTVSFIPGDGPQDGYIISYGLYSDAEMYNVTFGYSSKETVIPYTINALNANTTYYFKVRANNGCMPGEWSKTLSIKTPPNND